MKEWIFIYVGLHNYFPKDICHYVLQYVYYFKFETYVLKIERQKMVNEFKFRIYAKNVLKQLLETTNSVYDFLNQYRHEKNNFYNDTYNCSYYDCNCGLCGGIVDFIWCDYRRFKNTWGIDFHDELITYTLSPLDISNYCYQIKK